MARRTILLVLVAVLFIATVAPIFLNKGAPKVKEVIGPAIKVDQAPADVWAKLSDLSVAHYYVPGLTGTEITTELTQGVGASRKVLSKRPPMDETVLEWNEESSIFLRLHYGKQFAWGPFKEAYFRYSIRPDGSGATLLENSMRFELKGGAITNTLFGALMGKAFSSTLLDVTVAQRLYYETGEQVSAEQIKLAKQSL